MQFFLNPGRKTAEKIITGQGFNQIHGNHQRFQTLAAGLIRDNERNHFPRRRHVTDNPEIRTGNRNRSVADRNAFLKKQRAANDIELLFPESPARRPGFFFAARKQQITFSSKSSSQVMVVGTIAVVPC